MLDKETQDAMSRALDDIFGAEPEEISTQEIKSTSTEISIDDLVSVSEAAKLRSVSKSAVKDLIARGKLASQKIGGRVFLVRNDVLQYKPESLGGRPKKLLSNRHLEDILSPRENYFRSDKKTPVQSEPIDRTFSQNSNIGSETVCNSLNSLGHDRTFLTESGLKHQNPCPIANEVTNLSPYCQSASSLQFFTVKQCAENLGCTKQLIHKAIKKGRLRATPKGNSYLINPADLEAYKTEKAEPKFTDEWQEWSYLFYKHVFNYHWDLREIVPYTLSTLMMLINPHDQEHRKKWAKQQMTNYLNGSNLKFGYDLGNIFVFAQKFGAEQTIFTEDKVAFQVLSNLLAAGARGVPLEGKTLLSEH